MRRKPSIHCLRCVRPLTLTPFDSLRVGRLALPLPLARSRLLCRQNLCLFSRIETFFIFIALLELESSGDEALL